MMLQDVVAQPVGDTWEIFGRLAASMGAAVVLGVNRDLRGKPAGVRTHGLVAIGSCLVTVISMEFSATTGTLTPSGPTRCPSSRPAPTSSRG